MSITKKKELQAYLMLGVMKELVRSGGEHSRTPSAFSTGLSLPPRDLQASRMSHTIGPSTPGL